MAAIVQAGADQPLSFTVGDDVSVRFTVTDTSTLYVWTGATVTTAILANNVAVATNFTTATSVGGILDVSLTATQTTTLGVGTYTYYVKVAKGGVTTTWAAGNLSMHPASYGSASSLAASLTNTTTPSTTLSTTVSALTTTQLVSLRYSLAQNYLYLYQNFA